MQNSCKIRMNRKHKTKKITAAQLFLLISAVLKLKSFILRNFSVDPRRRCSLAAGSLDEYATVCVTDRLWSSGQ